VSCPGVQMMTAETATKAIRLSGTGAVSRGWGQAEA
jgi:hypothetical protein